MLTAFTVIAAKNLDHIKAGLDDLGSRGWELVSVQSYSGEVVFYFKRPIRD